jgi:4'-phosphopantetheinyl transferase
MRHSLPVATSLFVNLARGWSVRISLNKKREWQCTTNITTIPTWFMSWTLESADASGLDEGERNRAHRFVFKEHRRRFVAAHCGLRRVVGKFLQLDPKMIRFSAHRSGKPKLEDVSVDLRFNLSHSGERALVALTVGREVGIDIEQHISLDYLTLASTVFSETEVEALSNLALHDRCSAFYRGWTRKESFVKARGDGLAFDLKAFDVSLASSAPSLLLGCRPDTDEVTRWTMTGLDVGSTYEAALTVEGTHRSVVYWDDVEGFLARRR